MNKQLNSASVKLKSKPNWQRRELAFVLLLLLNVQSPPRLPQLLFPPLVAHHVSTSKAPDHPGVNVRPPKEMAQVHKPLLPRPPPLLRVAKLQDVRDMSRLLCEMPLLLQALLVDGALVKAVAVVPLLPSVVRALQRLQKEEEVVAAMLLPLPVA